QLLDEIGLLVGAARRGDDAHGLATVPFLDRLQPVCGEADCLVPAYLAPRLVDRLADHRAQDAVLVGRIAPGETALHAGMAAVRLAPLVGLHADEFIAAQFGLERAADPAIGAGGDDAPLGQAHLGHGFLLQAAGRADLDAGATGHAVGGEVVVKTGSGRHPAVEAPPLDRQREGALDFVAGAHAERADDAFR